MEDSIPPDAGAAIDKLDSASAWDAITPLLEAMAVLMPFGGLLGLMVGEVRRFADQSRTIEVLRAMEREVQEIREAIDPKAGAEFRRAFEWTLESATQAKHHGKRRFYAAAMARTATRARPGAAEQAVMLATLDALQEAHLLILAALVRDPQPPEWPGDYVDSGEPAGARMAAKTGLRPELLERCHEDLATNGIARSARIPMAPLAPGQVRPPVVTAFGRRFVAYVRSNRPGQSF